MAEALATKYRPKTFEEMVGQKSILQILNRQVEKNELKNTYLFCGASGCGKTTAARAFARIINKNIGSPIEIDGASNNGVDNVKNIIKSASERSIDSEYKIYIIDECHMITTQGWNAFLKCIEEPPTYTIFIFCTTDPQKIPPTILNRVQRYNFARIDTNSIKDRLVYICEQEGFCNYEESCEYIAKISNGGMREAISLLDKCSGLSSDLNIKNVMYSLGNYSYDIFFNLINSIIDGNQGEVLKVLSNIYYDGNDLKVFVDQFLSFCLDVSKYVIFQDCSLTSIPASMSEELKKVTNFDDSINYYLYFVDKLLELKNMIKQDSNMKSTIEVMLLQMTRLK
jgi:DNA polymerase-3 subunit gamma/tau